MLGDPSRAMCGAKHRRMAKLVEERLGHGHFGEDLVEDSGGCSVVGDCGLCHLQPMEGELGLYLGQLDAGWRSEQRVLATDGEGVLVQELGSTFRSRPGRLARRAADLRPPKLGVILGVAHVPP